MTDTPSMPDLYGFVKMEKPEPDVRLNGIGCSLDRYYSPAEVAAILGVSVTTIYRLTQRGEIPSLKLTRRVRISAKALAQWTKNRQRARA